MGALGLLMIGGGVLVLLWVYRKSSEEARLAPDIDPATGAPYGADYNFPIPGYTPGADYNFAMPGYN